MNRRVDFAKGIHEGFTVGRAADFVLPKSACRVCSKHVTVDPGDAKGLGRLSFRGLTACSETGGVETSRGRRSPTDQDRSNRK